MTKSWFHVASLILSLVPWIYSLNEDHSTTYEQFFELGMDAYRQEKWSKCSEFFQKAIDDFHFYKNTLIDCRLKCRPELPSDFSSVKLQLFHGMLEESNCLRRCKKQKFGMRPEGPQLVALDKKFESRTPYNYQQFCLFQEGKLKEAAAAAYTFYITNQDDQRIVGNMQYYLGEDGVVESDFKDLERRPYQTAYVTGLQAYNDGDWSASTEYFEKSLELYFVEEERCRAGCERPFTHTGYPDFVSAVADHYVVVTVCQQKCLQKLSTFGMEELENFVSEHFNYLQFAYYSLGNYEKAAEAIANFLLFRPNDEEMNKNKQYYLENMGLDEEKFKPSQMLLDYVNFWKDLGKSLDFIREDYILPNSEIKDDQNQTEDDLQEHYMAKYEKLGIRLFAETDQLKGPLRFAADEFLREDQCLSLADLAKSKTPNKLGIRSVNLSEMLTLVKDDGDYEMSLRLLLRATDIIQHYTAAYFNQSQLGTKEVKVLCQSGGDKWEKELPVDCIPQEDGSCLDKTDSGSEYKSITYLSDVTDGTGSFYFLDNQHKMQFSLQPRCGRLVGFATNNSYGVNFSWKKERCAVLMTFTSDLDLVTPDVKAGKDLLKNLEEALINESESLDNSVILSEFYRQGVSIAKTGDNLFGKERFAADGLATEAECQELIRLAKKGQVKDDGYGGNQKTDPLSSKYVSPYSKYENFAGLNISRALKLVQAGKVSAHSLQLLLDISEQGRLLVETYFNLSKPLYFDFTHLVCRTAVKGSEEKDEARERDLSHPVHSDNCMIQDDGTCIPDETAYAQRHYSALMYLNGDFEGGEFFFAHKNKSEQVSLKPKCGRIVGFNAGEYHGVKAVTKGQRCALAIWLTLDPNYKEIARFHTQRELDKFMKKSKVNKAKTSDKEEFGEHNIEDVERITEESDKEIKEESTEIDTSESKETSHIKDETEREEIKSDKTVEILMDNLGTVLDSEPALILEQTMDASIGINSKIMDIDKTIESDEKSSVVTIVSKLDLDTEVSVKESDVNLDLDTDINMKETDIIVNDEKDSLDDSSQTVEESLDSANSDFSDGEEEYRDEL